MAVINGTWAAETLFGTEYDDELYGESGDDALEGGAGNDLLDGGAGADTLTGGDGDDLYLVDDAGDTVVEAADGGYDVAQLWVLSYTMAANLEVAVAMGAGAVTIVGNALSNEIYGSDGDDWLEGGGGSDWLEGRGGVDTMVGGSGNDFYLIEEETDVVVEMAGGGIDEVHVTAVTYVMPAWVENAEIFQYWELLPAHSLTGNNLSNYIIVTYDAAQTVDGAGGSDTVSYVRDPFGLGVTVDLVTGVNAGVAEDDVLTSIENLVGSGGNDELRGTAGANMLDGSWGADRLVGRGGNDVYYVDDAGDDVVEAAGEGTDEVRVDFLTEYVLPANVERLRYIGWDDFTGTGNALNNELTGGVGNDWLYGGGGHDSLSGGAGDDRLFGGDGSDTLSGGSGADEMAGGDGSDIYIVDQSGDLVVELSGEGTDEVYAGIAAYVLPDHVEKLSANVGGAFAGTGNGLDNVLIGNSGADLLEGLAGADELRGQGGADTLSGGDGDDLLIGGSGADVLSGGAGADLFRISSYESGTGAAADRILDFAVGEDVIDLASMDAEYWTAGDQAFSWIGDAAFSNTAGELRYVFDGVDTRIQGDTDGDGFADFEIVLAGEILPTAADFFL